MARQQPESKLVNGIILRLRNEYPSSFWTKIHGGPYQQAGIPDIVGCADGLFIAIEVKLPGKENTVTKIQQLTLDLIHKAGGIRGVATSPDEAIAIIEEGVALQAEDH